MTLDDRHWRERPFLPPFKQRMTVRDWKRILLAGNDWITYHGNMVQLVAKKLGYGVVEVSRPVLKKEP